MKLMNRTRLMLGATLLATSLASLAYSEIIEGYRYKTVELKGRQITSANIDQTARNMDQEGWELLTNANNDRQSTFHMTFRQPKLSGDVDFDVIDG